MYKSVTAKDQRVLLMYREHVISATAQQTRLDHCPRIEIIKRVREGNDTCFCLKRSRLVAMGRETIWFYCFDETFHFAVWIFVMN